MKLSFEEIKEIGDRYGIKVTKSDVGEGGFITDETGETRDRLPMHLIDCFLRKEDIDAKY